jgi:hypothetical protein
MRAVAALVLVAVPVFACNCDRRLSACNEVHEPGAVFIGTVVSAAPSFMSKWNPLPHPSLQALNSADERYLADRSAANLAAIKDAFRKLFPALPEEEQKQVENASTHSALVSLFSSVLNHGQKVRLKVRTMFRNGDDDDDKADDDDDAKASEFLDVWTPFGDCGVDFQPGETYLVYANNDEETNILETETCTRTRRVTDASDDLAYLFFYKDRKNPAGRVDGFATFDQLYQVHRSAKSDPDRIDQPAAGVIIELKSAAGPRYTTTNADGRFVFDALPPGDHQVTAYAPGFPEKVKLLSGPRIFHVDARGCASQTLLVPKDTQQ